MPLDRDASARRRAVCLTTVLMSTGTSSVFGLSREEEKIAYHADCTICLALDEAHRFQLLTLQFILEQQLGEGGDSSERIVESVCNTGDELADGGELLGLVPSGLQLCAPR